MQPIVYLFFKDQCRAAMTHYGAVFGSTPEIMSVSDMPADARAGMPGVPADAVMHAALKIGEGWIYASDDPSGGTPAMAGCNLSVALPDAAETRRVYAALSEGGEIRQPLAPQFWTPLYAAFTDRFGIRWMVMSESPARDG